MADFLRWCKAIPLATVGYMVQRSLPFDPCFDGRVPKRVTVGTFGVKGTIFQAPRYLAKPRADWYN